ncbi:MAG: PKD domain-containing protein [Sphingobacteriales bacterium]
MDKIFTKSLFLLLIFAAFALKPVSAQTITIQNFTGGTYTPGSTIAAPFNISTASGCISQTNVFKLYLANSSGTILPGAPIGTFAGFYGTFVNGVIPAGTPAGTYTLVVKSTSPVVSSAPSASFTVAAGAIVTAGITTGIAGPSAISTNPWVFGVCNGSANNPFSFSDGSSTNSSTASFFNESTQSSEGTVTLAPSGSFTAKATNYTIIVKATNGTSISTQAYTLLNNVINNAFAVSNSNVVCLTSAGGGSLSYNVITSGTAGIQNNFPGTTYFISWGDGSSNTYTFCDISNLNGQISHNYTTGSCGHTTTSGQKNSFEVGIQPQSPYCSNVVSPITGYAKVLQAPTNSFTFPPAACANTTVTFTNTSDPGQDPNATVGSTCTNSNARYTWYVDGRFIAGNYTLGQPFTYKFTTNGNHTVTLQLNNSTTGAVCTASNVTQTICIQNPPQPKFTLPSTVCLLNPVIPTDNSVVDPACNNSNTYLWTVTGPAGVTYAGGTTAASHQPQFVFSQYGTYHVTLSIASTSCATTSATQTIYVDAPPVITLSPDAAICGTGQTYSFNTNPGITQTSISGTAQPQPNTYAWTVTGGTYSFTNGTTASSQYPQIKFTGYGVYTVSASEQNSCGTVTKSQKLNFQNVPLVTIDPSPTICPGSSATLTGHVNPAGSFTSVQWKGAGTFSSPNTLITGFTPTAAEINAGSATVTLDVKTQLTGACADILTSVTINIFPVNNITSPLTQQICTGNPVNYTITSAVAGSTYSWTATLTSGTATGFLNGNGPAINDVLTNNSAADAVVTYIISPKDPNGCTGTPFSLKVTVKPKPALNATPVNNTICSNSAGTINLIPNIAGTSYTWTSTVTGSIAGNSQQLTATASNTINDVLNNTGAASGTVSYIITPYDGFCPGIPVTVTITVLPLPATSNPGPNNEKCNIKTYQLNANTPPAGTGNWTVSPAGTVTFNDSTKPNAIAGGLTPGNTYSFTWTITIPGCQSSSNSVIITDDAPSAGGTTAGANTVCAGNNNGTITLSGQVGNILRWESSTDNGTTWQAIINTGASLLYFNLAKTTQYRAVVQNGVCAFAYSTVTVITVNPPAVTANAGPNQEVCNATTYALQGNNPAPYTGSWALTSGQTGVTFLDATQAKTTVSGLIPGNVYQFTWTVNPAAPCLPNSASVVITDDALSAGGTTAGANTTCAGNNNGSITLTGQVGNILRWESSTDKGTTWQAIINTGTSQPYLNLAKTTQYRAVVQNGVCTIAYSTVTVITVNPPAILANAGTNQEVCNVTSYVLQGNNPAPYTGSWALTSGQTGVTFLDATQAKTTVSGLVPGNVYQFTWTVNPAAPCLPNSASVVITDDALSAGGTTAGANAFCAGSNISGAITLTGQVGNLLRWESSTDNGATWQAIINTGASLPYLNLAKTTQYRAVVQNGVCTFAYSTVTVITVNPPAVTANAGTSQEICNVTSYILQGNNPAPNTGLWALTSGQTGVTFLDATQAKTTVSGLIPGNTYQFTWTINPAAPCLPNSASVVITDDAPTTGGTTTGANTVCAGSNSGSITLTGQVGSIVRWEASTDNGATWPAIINTATSLPYLNLTQTTQYRAVVQSGLCSIQNSTVTTITVNQPALQAIAGGNQNLCGATTTTLKGNNPSPFTGVWTQTAGPAATIVSPNNAQTQVTGLSPGNNFTFVWTIKSLPPCASTTDTLHIQDANDVTASFTTDKSSGCGDLTVNFANTSNVLTGTSFLWDFGDGTAQSTNVSPSHTFSQAANGKDTVYTVSLYIVNNCMQRPPFTFKITVRPQTPVAYITPRQIIGCSPFTLAVDNFSPGNNQSYTYYLYNGATLVQQITKTDKSEVQFNPITTKSTLQYTLYMVATGFCGNTGQSNIIPITISVTNVIAQMFIENGTNTGCVPLTLNFINNSFGGDNYYYTIYDVNHTVVDRRQGGNAPLPYTFNTVGTYYVTITAGNSCTTVESSPALRVDVYPVPFPQFTADNTTGCKNVTVNFTNQTPDDPSIQAKSLVYDWNFGDGSAHASTFLPPPHVYNFKKSPFTVTLTATNPVTNCTNVISKTAYINVTAPPATQFTEKPDSIASIPNYHFNFIDLTTGNPATWHWTFGDGQSSASQNPGHTYADTGVYKVTLTAATASGCDSTISHIVRVTGVPGQLYLPNAFEPGGGTIELKTFMAKGSGIRVWHLQIFNNFSQLIWETTKLDDKGAPVEGWDGTFKGVAAPQGVYVWQASATFINGTEWKGNVINNSLPKRVGVIHLIR